MKTAYDIIIKPVITEQSMEATEDKKYVFQGSRDCAFALAELGNDAGICGAAKLVLG